MVDGGFRRGSDIVKALALGAKGVLVGRATLFGVAAAGEAGAARAIDILRLEVDRVLALLGCRSVSELTPRHIVAIDSFGIQPRAPRIAFTRESRREMEPAKCPLPFRVGIVSRTFLHMAVFQHAIRRSL